MKKVIKEYIDNKAEIISDLLKRYEEININKDYEKDIKKLEKRINELKRKKEKLLELVINGYIDNQEFAKRNDTFNEEIKQNEDNIKSIENQKNDISKIKKNIETLDKEISSELDFEENIDDYIKLIIDKIIIHKINGDRKRVRLEIYFKLGDNKNIEYNMHKKNKSQKYLLCGHKENNDSNNSY